MLLVKTKIGPSMIHGIGIFADQHIPKGMRIWEYREGVDSRFDEAFLATLPETAQKQLLNYAYKNPRSGRYVLCGDDARFFNHSDTPNTEDLEFDEGLVEGEGITIAARDIEPGEEIVSDYRAFDKTFREKGII
jgi:SET domain-containing protein